MDNWLNTANAWLTYMLTVLILVGAVEGGALLARRHRARDPEKDADRFLSILAAPSIGLLALMIGFTFAMSLSRFEARRTAVLEEANAIGTAALRGSMLAEPYSTAVAPLFKEYAQLRVAHRGAALGSQQNAERLRRSTELQDSLWQQAMRAAKSNQSVVPTGLFIQALDVMIDAHEARLTADRNNVPAVVFLMLEGHCRCSPRLLWLRNCPGPHASSHPDAAYGVDDRRCNHTGHGPRPSAIRSHHRQPAAVVGSYQGLAVTVALPTTNPLLALPR